MNGPPVANSIRCPHIAGVEWPPVPVLCKRLVVAASAATSGYFTINKNNRSLIQSRFDDAINVSVFDTLLLTLSESKLCVNMSSHCMNTCFGASHRNYGDGRQILRCVVLWVGVCVGNIVRDSPSTSQFKLISPANIVLFGPYWYSEMSVDHRIVP